MGSLSAAMAQLNPSIQISDTVVCPGDELTFTANANGATLYFWEFGQGSTQTGPTNVAKHNYWQSGTYVVTLAVTDGTTYDTAFARVRVKPEVQADFSLSEYSSNGMFCITTQFNVSMWSGMDGFDSLKWDFGDGTMYDKVFPSHRYSQTGQYTVTLEAWGYCGYDKNTQDLTIVDDANGKPSVSVYVPETLCPGTEFEISASYEHADSIVVDPGDGMLTEQEWFPYRHDIPGMYKVEAYAYNACGADTADRMVNVSEMFDHEPQLNISQYQLPCPGMPVSVSASAKELERVIFDFGDGTSDTLEGEYVNINHSWSAMDTFTVTAIYHYKCGAPDTMTEQAIIGMGAPYYQFSLGSNLREVCPGEIVNIYPPYLRQGDTLFIDFGDGSTQHMVDRSEQVVHSFMSHGLKIVKAVRTSACGFKDSSELIIDVTDYLMSGELKLLSDYQYNEWQKCQGDTIHLRLQSGGHSLKNATIHFNGKSVNSMDVKDVFNKGRHLVTAEATDLCGTKRKAAHYIDVTDKMLLPGLDYYFYPLAECVHQEFFFDVFASLTRKMIWDFGDGTVMEYNPNTGPHVMHAYNEAGRYDVNIRAINGCGETEANSVVKVVPGPEINFSMSSSNIMVGDSVTFINQTQAETTGFVFNMNEEDSSFARSVKRTYDQAGSYPVTVWGINRYGCWDSTTKFVNVGTASVRDINGKEHFRYYPNPVKSTLHIEWTGSLQGADIELYDLSGRLLENAKIAPGTNRSTLNLSMHKRGTYLLRVQTAEQIFNAKLILTH